MANHLLVRLRSGWVVGPVQVGVRRMAAMVLHERRMVVATSARLPVVRVLIGALLVVGVMRRGAVTVQVPMVAMMHLLRMVIGAGRMGPVTVGVPMEGSVVLWVAVRVLRVAIVEGVIHHHVILELLVLVFNLLFLLLLFLFLFAGLCCGRRGELVEVCGRGACHGPASHEEGLWMIAEAGSRLSLLAGRLLRPRSGKWRRRSHLTRGNCSQVLAVAH